MSVLNIFLLLRMSRTAEEAGLPQKGQPVQPWAWQTSLPLLTELDKYEVRCST